MLFQDFLYFFYTLWRFHYFSIGCNHYKIRHSVSNLVFCKQIVVALSCSAILLPFLWMFVHSIAPCIFFHVNREVNDSKSIFVFLSKFFQFGESSKTLTTPACPEINQNKSSVLWHNIFEVSNLVVLVVYFKVDKFCAYSCFSCILHTPFIFFKS